MLRCVCVSDEIRGAAETFEGLGIGSRLAFLRLPPKYNYVAVLAAILYGLTTPIGIAAGLGVRTTYDPNSATANIVSGILDSFSSGILLYTGLVEVRAASGSDLLFAVSDEWLLYVAHGARVPVQHGYAARLEREARVRAVLHDLRRWDHGATGPLGLSCRLRGCFSPPGTLRDRTFRWLRS